MLGGAGASGAAIAEWHAARSASRQLLQSSAAASASSGAGAASAAAAAATGAASAAAAAASTIGACADVEYCVHVQYPIKLLLYLTAFEEFH